MLTSHRAGNVIRTKENRTFPPEASVSVYLQHRVGDAAHVQAFLFLDVGWIRFSPDSGSRELKSNFTAQIYQDCDTIRREVVQREDEAWILIPEIPALRRLLSEPSGGGAAGGWGDSSNRMEEVGKLMSLQINTRGCWNLSSVTKSSRGCGGVFRTSASSETRRRWSGGDPDQRSEADKIFFSAHRHVDPDR